MGFGSIGPMPNFCFSFVVVTKEHEIEIGYPTDVKHVAHIGWDGPSGGAPTWVCIQKLFSFNFLNLIFGTLFSDPLISLYLQKLIS